MSTTSDLIRKYQSTGSESDDTPHKPPRPKKVGVEDSRVLDALKDLNNKFTESLSDLTTKITSQATEQQNFRRSIEQRLTNLEKNLNSKIAEESKIIKTEFQLEIASISNKISAVEISLQSLQTDYDREITEMKERIERIETLERPGADAVDFSPEVTTVVTGLKYTEEEDILQKVFDEELADVGEDYDPSTGQFTVPDDGVYVFTLSVHLANSASNSVRVRKNGVNVLYVLYVVNSYSSSTDSGTTTTTLLVDCQQGDVISVYESTAYRYVARATSFTGFRLLNPDPSKEELVSFHAALGGANTDIVNHYAIVFDVAYVNVGNFYNPEFGIFICPDNATYFFSWSITLAAESHKRAGQAQLVLSDHVKKVGPQTGRVLTGAYSSTASTQTVLRCIKSKAVAIQAVVPGQNHLTLYYHTTNFVGFRLPPI